MKKCTSSFLSLIIWSLFLSMLQPLGAQSSSVSSESKISTNYKLQPKDVFRVEVFQEPDLTKEVRVNASGSVVLPLIGSVRVGGYTVEEVQNRIQQLYAKDYLVNPHINLLVLDFTTKRVEVLGQVNNPGPVLIPPEEELTLTKAISGASGATRLANLKTIRLTRTDENGKTTVQRLNFVSIGKGDAPDIKLRDGDTIYVEERFL